MPEEVLKVTDEVIRGAYWSGVLDSVLFIILPLAVLAAIAFLRFYKSLWDLW